jgi:hypothetical protein
MRALYATTTTKILRYKSTLQKMEPFKFDIYKSENPDLDLNITSLDPLESGKIIGFLLCHHMIDDPQIKNSNFFHLLEKSVEKISCQEITSALIDQIIQREEVDKESEVFIIWDLDTLVDKTDCSTLIINWDYIWYDASDEALILFFVKSKLTVLITDRGYYSKFHS